MTRIISRKAGRLPFTSGFPRSNEKNRKSIAVQQKEMETFAQENGIDVVGLYIDGGDDGDVAECTSKFPSAMHRLLADAGSPD